MKVDFAVLCDYALIDQYGKLSVLGIFQHIWVVKFPTIHPRLHLVVRLKGKRTEIGEHQLAIQLVDDAGDQLLTGSGTVTFNEPPAGVLEIEAGTVLAFDVPLQGAGRYAFEIRVDGQLDAVVPLTVSESRGDEQGAGPALH